jgi:hypothetical protein
VPVVAALALKALLAALLLAAAAREPPDASHVGPHEPGTPRWAWQLARGWDAHAYQRIAAHGYENAFSHAFPPGYPAMIAVLRPLAGTYQAAALLATNLCAVLALLVFLGLARTYASARAATGGAAGRDAAGAAGGVALALGLFACLPGELAYGTVAYSEAPFILVTLLAWTAYRRAEARGPDAPRASGWLLLGSWLFAAGSLVRLLGIALFVGLALIEGRRVLRARGPARRRALLEAACVLSGGLGAAAWMVYAERVLHYGESIRETFGMGFSPLGGLPGLLALGTAPEYVVQAALCVPVALALLVPLARVDGRLALLAGCMILLALSSTGVAAQSTGRFVWTAWPLALAGLALRERALGWGLCGLLFLWSVQAGVGHVLGTSML